MKKTILYLVLIAFLFGSCNQDETVIFKHIPAEAYLVSTFNAGQLIDKGQINELNILNNEDDVSALFVKITKKPEESGLNLDTYSSLFKYDNDMDYIALISGVSDEEKLEANLEVLCREMDFSFNPEKTSGLNFQTFNNAMVAWDQDMLYILLENEGFAVLSRKDEIIRLKQLQKEESILPEKDFSHFLENQEDINLWVNSSHIPKFKVLGGSFGLMGGLENNYGNAFITFEDGYMSMTTNLRFNRNMKSMIEKYNFLDRNAIKELLKYLPSKDLFFVGNTSVNPEKLNALLEYVYPGYENTLRKMDDNLDGESLKKIFSGEIAFSLNGIYHETDSLDNEDVEAVFAARIKNKKYFEKFLSLIHEKASIEDKGNYFMLKDDDQLLYFTTIEDDLIITSKEETLKTIIENGVMKDNVTQQDYAEILTENPICFYVNFKEGENSKKMLERFENGAVKSLPGMNVEDFGHKIESASFSANLEEWKLRIDLVNDEENSLYTLLRMEEK